jgi:hypothetical protein
MDSIERDLRTYRGVRDAARARAQGIRKLLQDQALAARLHERGVDSDDADHLEAAAVKMEEGIERMRQLWAELQQASAALHDESSALADEIRATDDAARAALGRKSEHLPTLGIKPLGRHRAAKAQKPATGTP